MIKDKWGHMNHKGGDAVYGLGLIGALVYYFQHSTNFLEVLVGIFKSLVWPAFVVYKLLERLI